MTSSPKVVTSFWFLQCTLTSYMFQQISSVAIFHEYIHTIIDVNDIVELHYVRMVNMTNDVQLSRQKFGDKIVGSFFPIYNLGRNFDMFPTVQNFAGESYFAV